MLMACTSIAFAKQGPRLSRGIALVKLVAPPTINQVGWLPILKVVKEVAHCQEVAFRVETVAGEDVKWYLLMLGDVNLMEYSTDKTKACRVDRVQVAKDLEKCLR
jgi:hypothetical protein